MLAVFLCTTALPVVLAPRGAYDSLRGEPLKLPRRPAASDIGRCEVQITPLLPRGASNDRVRGAIQAFFAPEGRNFVGQRFDKTFACGNLKNS